MNASPDADNSAAQLEQLLQQADVATAAQDWDAVIATYRKLLSFDRMIQGAEAKLQWALRMKDIETLYQQGKAHLEAHRHTEALTALRKARLMYASHYKDTDQLIVEAQAAMQKENWQARPATTSKGCFLLGSLIALIAMLVLGLSACATPSPTPGPTATPIKMPTAGIAPTALPQSPDATPEAFDKIPPQKRNNTLKAPPKIVIDTNKQFTATIKTTKGDIVVELAAKDAPFTTNNFISLSRTGFYSGLTFHRVEPGFVIQGGDPLGDGTGGPGYTLPAEIKLKHVKGAIAMARQGDNVNPNRESSGSQFYITLAATPHLDNAYTVFGQVTQGMDVVEKINKGDLIQTITITEK
jgi:cyclophilin family peptidyl-prolyl cis-trans isomerase